MRELCYLAAARGDLADIQDDIATASQNMAAGQNFTKTLRAQCAKLASVSATLGRPRPELRPDLRSFLFKGYIIFFRYKGDTLEIVNILAASRDIPPLFRNPGPKTPPARPPPRPPGLAPIAPL